MTARLRSISSRFIAAAAGTAAITFVCLLGLVGYQVGQSIDRQKVKLEKLSDAKLASTLDADIRLASSRLKFLVDDTVRRVSAIASRTDTVAVVSSRNVVAIWEILGQAAANADVDNIVVLDAIGKVIGASSDKADLIGLNHHVAEISFAGEIQNLLKTNRPDKPETFTALLPFFATGDLIPGKQSNAISQIVFVPLFDDFGEISGGLLAQRWLREQERLLLEFAQIGSVGLVVLHGNQIISRAGYDGNLTSLIGSNNSNISADGRNVVRCGSPVAPLKICALKPIQELYATQTELTKIGKEEERSLLRALAVFGFGATMLFIASSVIISRQITRPLTRITGAVSSVAAGDYEDDVDGTSRMDEVGDIARAVVLLQASVKERDSLRSKVQLTNEALQEQEVELRKQNVLFDAALNNMSHGLCMFDAEKRLIVSNQSYLELFDLSRKQVVRGMTIAQLTAAQAGSAGTSQDPDNSCPEREEDWPRNRRSAKTIKLADGRIILTTRQPLADGGWVAIFEDVTEQEKSRERLAHQASHDGLTDLPNRIRLREHLDLIVRQRNAEGGTFGILCIDLDEFKTVNDSLGHPIGDELLRQVAKRLLKMTDDQQLVVRLGGDEFAIVTDIPTSGPELKQMAGNVIAEISKPYHVDHHETIIGASIGISVSHDQRLDGDELFKQADVALYQAKAAGRNTYRFFEEEMGTLVSDRRELIIDMRKAIKHGELECHFQPQVRVSDESITGFEALMRWRHPRRGMISPAEFIPIAEETGLIVELGEWIMREACRIAATWPQPLRIAVNISARQLKSPGFAALLINNLAATGLQPDRLELEVTESVLLGDDEATLQVLHRAKSLGVKVSMDDFGTGYSSLSCLRSFPFDKIKIDRSFVLSMAHSKDSQSIVRAIIDLAQSLNMTTTGEGVETEELSAILRACGCTEAQGYFFGKPVPAEDVEDLVALHFLPEKLAANV